MQTLEDRFWSKVDRRGDDECWPWLASKTKQGYGRFYPGHGKDKVPAHRTSYELHFGDIPAGMLIDHMCHSPTCVNPAHLQVVTRKQNQENIKGLSRHNTSGVRGVWWNKRAKKWQGGVSQNNKTVHVGYFVTIDEAEKAVMAKRNELYTNNLTDRRPA